MKSSEKRIERAKNLIVFLGLTILVITFFWQVRTFELIELDDSNYIIENSDIKKGLTKEGIIWAFSENKRGSFWQPVVWLSFLLDYEIAGKKVSPKILHYSNIVYHLITTLLCYLVFKKLTGSILSSLFISLIFSIHPQRIESVVWVTERKDVLFGLFWFLSLLAYINYTRTLKIRNYFLALGLFIISLMSKAMGVTLPCVMLLLDFWPLQRLEGWKDFKTRFQEKIPFFLFAILVSILTFIFQSRHAIKSLEQIPLQIRFENALISYATYIVDYICPQNLCVFYPYSEHLPLWEVIFSATLLISISILAIRLIKDYPWFFTGWFWYLGTLFPVIGFFQSGKQAMADRFMYIPHLGLSLILAMILYNCRSRVIYTVFAAFALMIALLGFNQVGYWKNNQVLFEYTLEVTGKNLIAERCLGSGHLKRGNIKKALEHYSNALLIDPDSHIEHYNMGLAFFLANNSNMAEKYLRSALAINANYIPAHNNLGIVLIKIGKTKAARFHFNEAERLKNNSKGNKEEFISEIQP